MPSPVAPGSRLSPAKNRPASLARRYVGEIAEELFGESLHEKRLLVLSNGVVGFLHAATLSSQAIGAAHAAVAQRQAKHGIKQVDRWLSNSAFDVTLLGSSWITPGGGCSVVGCSSNMLSTTPRCPGQH